MTFEEKLDRLCSGELHINDYIDLRFELINDYELLLGEYQSWSALALAWFKWSQEASYAVVTGQEDLDRLVDRTIVEVG